MLLAIFVKPMGPYVKGEIVLLECCREAPGKRLGFHHDDVGRAGFRQLGCQRQAGDACTENDDALTADCHK